MAEGKLIAFIGLSLAGCFGFVYSLATIPWDDIKAVILLIIGACGAVVFLCRNIVKLIREVFDLKQHIKKNKI